jgi:hypothetical protein
MNWSHLYTMHLNLHNPSFTKFKQLVDILRRFKQISYNLALQPSINNDQVEQNSLVPIFHVKKKWYS